MSSASWPLQQAVYTALTGDVPLMAAVSGVFDDVVQDYDNFPYVTIGEDTRTPFDTDDKTGGFHSITVHVWSRESGRKETKIVQGYIYDILNRNLLSVTGFDTVDVLEDSSQIILDPDGETRHGIQTYTATIRST